MTSDTAPTAEGFETALTRVAEAIETERPERQRANRIVIGGIVIALLLLTAVLVQGQLDRADRDRRIKDATAQRVHQLALAKQGVVVADQVQRGLYLLNCAVIVGEHYPNESRHPELPGFQNYIRDLNECFRLNNVHPNDTIKLPAWSSG